MCYIKCQNIFVNVLVHLLEHLGFRLRCPSFLLSKFASQLKLIQSVVRIATLGICVTSSVLRVLLSRFWVSGSQVSSPRDPVPGSWVSGLHVLVPRFQGPRCQEPVSQGPRCQGPVSLVSGSRFPSLRVPGLMVPGSRVPGSLVSGPDFRLCRKKRSFFDLLISFFHTNIFAGRFCTFATHFRVIFS